MKYDFDKEIERRGTNCEKYDNLNAVFGCCDIIPAWIADTDFATPDFIMEAVKKRAEHSVLGYSFRSESYHKSIIDFLERRSGWKVEKEWLEFSPGVVCGISYMIQLLSEVGDNVVIQPPVYPPFARCINANKRNIVNNPLVWNGNGYDVDFEDLDKKLEGSKLLILCSPHNPTGKVYTKEELTKMGELCIKHGVRIVSDEIHSDIIFSGVEFSHIGAISKEIADITTTLLAPSKTFNIAGLSTSVAIIPNSQTMKLYRESGDTLHVDQGNIFGAVALESAYTHGDEWLDSLLIYLEENANFVVEYITQNMPNIGCYKPQSTFLMWLDCTKLGMSSDKLCQFMVQKAKVGLGKGLDFGIEGEKFIRLNIGTTKKQLKTILDRMKSAYDQIEF
ncbi:MAG: MalY/PatB family protein [Rikenellaceae bacterium]